MTAPWRREGLQGVSSLVHLQKCTAQSSPDAPYALGKLFLPTVWSCATVGSWNGAWGDTLLWIHSSGWHHCWLRVPGDAFRQPLLPGLVWCCSCSTSFQPTSLQNLKCFLENVVMGMSHPSSGTAGNWMCPALQIGSSDAADRGCLHPRTNASSVAIREVTPDSWSPALLDFWVFKVLMLRSEISSQQHPQKNCSAFICQHHHNREKPSRFEK